jgi:uncharacterized protein
MDATTNALNWFEIPATDIHRAKKFYEDVFGIEMEHQNMMGMEMAFFPYEGSSGKASGALVQGPNHKPSQEGAVIYLNANPNMDDAIGKIESAGGIITMPKMKISDEVGYMAFFTDSEGNKVGIHSNN